MIIELQFGDDICCLVAEIKDLEKCERDYAEDACLLRAIESRRVEFHAGRSLLRIAMSRMGLETASIPVGAHREPIWPDAMIGSISHNRTHVGVAIAVSSSYKSIGLDIEKHAAITPDMLQQILVPDEVKAMHERGIDPTLFFSCKEAVFKAVYPIHCEYFDFTDVRISENNSGFIANDYNRQLSFADTIDRGLGLTISSEKYMANLFLIASDQKLPNNLNSGLYSGGQIFR